MDKMTPLRKLNYFMAFVGALSFLLAILLCGCTTDKWSKRDIALEAAYIALHTVDYLQTRQIAKHPDKWHERNPVLGRHPSVGEVGTFFLGTAIVQLGVAHLLPEKYRVWWISGNLISQVAVVGNNFNVGIGVKW